jgi:hypothetical protein
MANTIIIKNSSTTTAVPIAGNLVEAVHCRPAWCYYRTD